MPEWPEVRKLDGVFIRVQIDGKWANRCLTDCPWEEVDAWLTRREAPESYTREVAKILHQVVRELGDQFDIMRGSPEEKS